MSRRDASGAEFYVNAGATKQRGVEYSLIYSHKTRPDNFLTTFKLQAVGSNINARFGEYQQGNIKYTGNQLTGTSPFTFSLLGDVQTANGMYTNITYTYTDKIAVNDANTFFAKPYNVLLVKLGVDKHLSKQTRGDFFGIWNKVFNQNYSLGNDLNAAGNRFFNPSVPQVITVGVRLYAK